MNSRIVDLKILGIIVMILAFAACKEADQVVTGNQTIIIGKQEWTIKNVDVSTFRNGDSIIEARTEQEWIKAWQEGTPAWCHYNNDPALGEKYGKIYNLFAVNDPRGLCPEGWHIADNDEWNILVRALESDAGQKMKSTHGWLDGGNGTNSSRRSEYHAHQGHFRHSPHHAVRLSQARREGAESGRERRAPRKDRPLRL